MLLPLFGVCLLWATMPTAAGSCPSKCHCLPDASDASQMKIVCHWASIPNTQLPFVTFPVQQAHWNHLVRWCWPTGRSSPPMWWWSASA